MVLLLLLNNAAPKKDLEKALEAHPDILKIDGHIAELNEELKALGDR
jgi:hypothetical protein